MVSFPLRLILAAWSGAALAGLAVRAAGVPVLPALFVFWLGGTAAVFVLPLVHAGFRRAAQEPGAEGAGAGEERRRRLAREHARWAEDLAGETIAAARHEPPRKAG